MDVPSLGPASSHTARWGLRVPACLVHPHVAFALRFLSRLMQHNSVVFSAWSNLRWISCQFSSSYTGFSQPYVHHSSQSDMVCQDSFTLDCFSSCSYQSSGLPITNFCVAICTIAFVGTQLPGISASSFGAFTTGLSVPLIWHTRQA